MISAFVTFSLFIFTLILVQRSWMCNLISFLFPFHFLSSSQLVNLPFPAFWHSHRQHPQLFMARGRSTSSSPEPHRRRGKRDRRTSRRSRTPRRKSTGLYRLRLLLHPTLSRLGTPCPNPGPPTTSTWIISRNTN